MSMALKTIHREAQGCWCPGTLSSRTRRYRRCFTRATTRCATRKYLQLVVALSEVNVPGPQCTRSGHLFDLGTMSYRCVGGDISVLVLLFDQFWSR